MNENVLTVRSSNNVESYFTGFLDLSTLSQSFQSLLIVWFSLTQSVKSKIDIVTCVCRFYQHGHKFLAGF